MSEGKSWLEREKETLKQLKAVGYPLTPSKDAPKWWTRLYLDSTGQTIHLRTAGMTYVSSKKTNGMYLYPAWQLNIGEASPNAAAVIFGLFNARRLLAILKVPTDIGIKHTHLLKHRLLQASRFGELLYVRE